MQLIHILLRHIFFLAVIYIKDNEYSRAKKLLNTVLHIDKNNTLACKYMDEIKQVQTAKDNDASGSFLPRKRLRKRKVSLLTVMMLYFQGHLIKNQAMVLLLLSMFLLVLLLVQHLYGSLLCHQDIKA